MEKPDNKTREGKLILVFFAIAVAIPFSFMIITTIFRGVYQPFLNDYTQRYALPESESGTALSLPSPVYAIIISPSAQENSYGQTTIKYVWDLANFRLSSKVRAGSPNEVNVIIYWDETDIAVGNYNDGRPAYQKQIELVVIDARTNSVLGGNVFLGGDPPASKTGSGAGYGSSPKGAAARWLNSFLLAR